jgi:hypothetical protein
MASAWKASIGLYVQSVKLMACPISPSSAAARSVDWSFFLSRRLSP